MKRLSAAIAALLLVTPPLCPDALVITQAMKAATIADIYLETRRSLDLENQGGARAKVQNVTIVDSKHEPLGGEIGVMSTCTWNVSGSVGHWGHVHTCENQYQARFVVKSVDGLWKITESELLPEERLPG